jgi:short-subunit dehydrogenase
MIARNRGKMEAALAKIKDIEENSEIQTKYIVADFSECGKEGFFETIVHALKDLDISILVNNVGISNIGIFHSIPAKRIQN